MKSIAILLTCFNREKQTLNALKLVYEAYELVNSKLTIDIYLTDDGSTDGTSSSVREKYPAVNIYHGNGELYWAGGMRNSWNEAIKNNYDAYLLLNDDTDVFETVFSELFYTHQYCKNKHKKSGIYIGSTINPKTNKLSYGGSIFVNRFLAKSIKLLPNKSTPQECELGNANIMLVTKEVVQEIGILSDNYIHGLADFDYTLMAKKNNIPVLITPNYLGNCLNENKNKYSDFHLLSLSKRIELLNSPIGLDFKSNLFYMKRNFPLRLPFVFLAGWFKVIFPKTYRRIHLTRK